MRMSQRVGADGTASWVDPKEDMLVVYTMQSPSKRTHYRAVLRDMIYAAMVKCGRASA